MPVSARLLSIPLRLGELAFAATIAGLVGHYLHDFAHVHAGPYNRFIYTEVIAGLSMIFALIWLVPYTGGFTHYPMDFVLSTAWLVAFGLLVAFAGPIHCDSVWRWGNITEKGMCEEWKAVVAFSLLSAILWLVSGLLGIKFIDNVQRDVNGVRTSGANAGRRKWYRSHNV